MKKKFIFILLLIITTLSFADKNYKFESTFGFLSSGTLLSSFKDARVAVRAWLEDVSLDYDGKLNVEFYESSEVLYKNLKNGNVDMAVLDLNFFFKNKKDIELNTANYWSLSMNDTKYSQYYLISRTSDNLKTIKDLKNRTISLKEADNASFTWIDKNSLQTNKKDIESILKKIKYEKKESTILLNVFFKKTDFSVVSKKTWDTMVELNPSILKKLTVVKKSEKIYFPFIGLFNKKAAQSSVAAFFNLSRDLTNIEGSEQIINMLKFNSIFRVNEQSLRPLEIYYNEYFELKKRYK